MLLGLFFYAFLLHKYAVFSICDLEIRHSCGRIVVESDTKWVKVGDIEYVHGRIQA